MGKIIGRISSVSPPATADFPSPQFFLCQCHGNLTVSDLKKIFFKKKISYRP